MLTKQRHEMILKLLEEKGSITVTEIRDLLKASESTVRRDITALDKEGRLVKVFGGAIANKQSVTSHEYTVCLLYTSTQMTFGFSRDDAGKFLDSYYKAKIYESDPVSYTHLDVYKRQVYTDQRGQIIFLDTPGIHKAKNKLGEYMVNVAEHTLKEVDVILWLVEPTDFIGAGERHIAEQLNKVKTPVILIINKTDTIKNQDEILRFISAYKDICPFAEIVPVSALKKKNTDLLTELIFKYLPYGPQYYDEDLSLIHI